MVWPLRLKVKELDSVKSSLESMLNNKDLDLQMQNEKCHKLQKDVDDLRRKSEHYASQLMDLKDEQRSDDFKVRNFNRIKSERDQLQEEKNFTSKKLSELEILVATLRKERNILEERCNEYKTKARKQESDLSHYQSDFSDSKTKLDKAMEDLRSVSQNLRVERERSDGLQERYVATRGEVTSLVESNQDLQHEVKILREKHNSCVLECTNLEAKVDQLSARNGELSSDVDKYKKKYDTEVKILEHELKALKETYADLVKTRDSLRSDNSRFHQDIQALDMALHREKILREKETTTLKEELHKYKQNVLEYEALEEEVAKNIRTAASLPEDQAGGAMNRILPGYALIGNKAVEHSVQLTRRVLMLERQNTEAATTIQHLTDALEQLRNKVASYKSAINLAGQPSSNLLERIAALDNQVTALQEALQFNSTLKSRLEEENKSLTRDVSKLKQSLENLTLQNSEISAIKEHLRNVRQTIGHVSSKQMDGKERPSTSAGEPEAHLASPPKSPARAIIITKNIRGKP